MDIQTAAREMFEALEIRTRDNGSTFVSLKDGSPEWMTGVARKAHLDHLPNDWYFGKIQEILEIISEHESADDMRDAAGDIEPDCYTANLISWLGLFNSNIEYLTQVLGEYEVKDGFKALAWAQSINIQEIVEALIAALDKAADE